MNFHLLSFPCTRCERPIEVTPPYWFRTIPAANGTLAFDLEVIDGFGDPALCLSCRAASAPPDAALRLGEFSAAALALKTDLDIPPDVRCWWLEFAHDGTDPSWRGFRGQFMAAQAFGLPWPPPVRAFRFWPDQAAQPLEMLVYQTAIWREDVPAILEVRWHPERDEESMQIRHWEQIQRKRDWDRLMRGVQLLNRLDTRGRKREDDLILAEFSERYAIAWWTCHDRHGRTPPTLEVAAEMGLSPATFHRHRTLYHQNSGTTPPPRPSDNF